STVTNSLAIKTRLAAQTVTSAAANSRTPMRSILSCLPSAAASGAPSGPRWVAGSVRPAAPSRSVGRRCGPSPRLAGRRQPRPLDALAAVLDLLAAVRQLEDGPRGAVGEESFADRAGLQILTHAPEPPASSPQRRPPGQHSYTSRQ